jgi:hypothetical protein
MKLKRFQGQADAIEEFAVKLQPKQIVQIVYVGENVDFKSVFALWYWEVPV